MEYLFQLSGKAYGMEKGNKMKDKKVTTGIVFVTVGLFLNAAIIATFLGLDTQNRQLHVIDGYCFYSDYNDTAEYVDVAITNLNLSETIYDETDEGGYYSVAVGPWGESGTEDWEEGHLLLVTATGNVSLGYGGWFGYSTGVLQEILVTINVTLTLPPEADFKYSPSGINAIKFTDLSCDEDGSIVNYTWKFGDGNTSYEQNPQHQYADAGTYNVSLTITDDDGVTDSISKNVSVWTYRKPINLWVSSGKIPAYYQVLLNISYNASMNPDFSDLRFIRYADNTTELDYWIEKKIDGSWCNVWVEIADSITTQNKTLAWMYYGNPNAISASNGDETFLFFDDFNDGIYRDKWNIDENSGSIGTAYQFNGKLFLRTKEIDRTISLITKESFESLFDNNNGTVLEYDAWTKYNPPYPQSKDGSLHSYLINASNPSQWVMGSYSGWSGNVRLSDDMDNSAYLGRTSRRTHNIHSDVSLGCNASNAWMNWNEINDPGWVEDNFNGSISTADFSGATSVKIRLELHCGGSSEGQWSQVAFDNVRLRKYHDSEPEHDPGCKHYGYFLLG